jgi:type VI secretion system secreted protein VgrG
MASLYELQADFLPSNAQVVSFDGEEALNRLYRFRVLFSVPLEAGLSLDLDGATGQTAKFFINRESSDAPARTYSGTVAALELVEDLQRFSLLRLHLVPRLWKLSLGEHSRVFVDKALPDIITETLEAGGLTSSDYELRLTGKYRAYPHTCQLRESRLAFLTRWLERAGAYYFFEQGDEQEKLIITDNKSSHHDSVDKPVRFVPQLAGDAMSRQALRSFRWRHEVLPKKVAVADYYPLNPFLKVEGSADIAPDGAGGDINLFKINEEAPDQAKSFAETRAREYLAGQVICRAHGPVFGLMPGFTFSMEEHPRAELNQGYLVIETRHRGAELGVLESAPQVRSYASSKERYHCEIEAVPASEHYLPLRTTRWPRVAGTVRAFVDAEAESELAQLDDHGRYLVRLMLDESGLPAGAASTRIRMIQPHAGSPEGYHFPLRPGTEVQVGFLRGDPDQPVITGVVPNATTASPVTRSNRTQNVLQTGGLNRLEIDDAQGSEYFDLSTPPEKTFMHLGAHAGLGSHNYVFSTKGDYAMHTGGNRDIVVGGDQTEKVTGDVNEDYHADQTTTVDGSLTETIDASSTQTIHAGSTQTIDGGVTQTIDGGETRTVTGGQTETIDGGRTQTITGSSTEVVTGSITQSIDGGATISTPGAYTVTAAGGFELNTPGTATLMAAGGFNLLAPGGQTRLDEDFTMFGGEYKVLSPNQVVGVQKRIDLRGLYLELVAVKFDFYSLKWTVGKNLKQTSAVYIGTDGMASTRHAFSKHQTGFKAWGS